MSCRAYTSAKDPYIRRRPCAVVRVYEYAQISGKVLRISAYIAFKTYAFAHTQGWIRPHKQGSLADTSYSFLRYVGMLYVHTHVTLCLCICVCVAVIPPQTKTYA